MKSTSPTQIPQFDVSNVQVAQWILDKQLAWIAAADAKVAVVVAIDTAIFAALAAAFSTSKSPTDWAVALSLAAACLMIAAIVCAALSLFPRTDGPSSSLVFFGPISKLAGPDYVNSLCSSSLRDLHQDIASQVHRNAEIASRKHHWVRRSIAWSFLASMPWAAAVYLLVQPSSCVP